MINFDQTGVHIVLVSNQTFAWTGFQQEALQFKRNKCQITTLLAGTAAGEFLSEQLIFQGKTNACHSKV